MNKATKILVAVLAVGIAALCVGMGYTAVKNGDDTSTTIATVTPTTTKPTTETTTETTTEKEPELAELLIGKWSDSAGMSGFEFFENGKVSFTYANLESLGIGFDGKVLLETDVWSIFHAVIVREKFYLADGEKLFK